MIDNIVSKVKGYCNKCGKVTEMERVTYTPSIGEPRYKCISCGTGNGSRK